MTSKRAESDLETLLSMDIKLRLLDAEGVDIPQDPPPIPDDPPNYDFCYELKWSSYLSDKRFIPVLESNRIADFLIDESALQPTSILNIP